MNNPLFKAMLQEIPKPREEKRKSKTKDGIPGQREDLTGQKIGKVKIVSKIGTITRAGKPLSFYSCQCECGEYVEKNAQQLNIKRNVNISCRKCKHPRKEVKK